MTTLVILYFLSVAVSVILSRFQVSHVAFSLNVVKELPVKMIVPLSILSSAPVKLALNIHELQHDIQHWINMVVGRKELCEGVQN